MGISGMSIWQLLIILAIVVMLFGTKRLKTLGSDLGSMIKGFKNSMANDEQAQKDAEEAQKNLEQKNTANNTSTEKTEQNNTKV
jgi:sec-independent protein translocase protein TatA